LFLFRCLAVRCVGFTLQNPMLEPDWAVRFAFGIARNRAVGLESVPIKWEESYEC